ncbi:MAG: AraC family transcriptional regulator [Prevotellaceae bacterium]|nr:AraC family transcriptional regulator [Prevotellaceae bacterium]
MTAIVDSYYGDSGLMLYWTCIVSCFGFAYALLINKSRTPPQIWLAVIFIVMGVGMSVTFSHERYGADDRNEMMNSLNHVFNAAMGIIVLFYMMSLMRPEKLTRRYILSFCAVPFLFLLLAFCSSMLPRTVDWSNLADYFRHPLVVFRIFFGVLLICFHFYLAFTLFSMYFSHKRFISESYSWSEGIHLRWILWVIVIFCIFAVMDMVWYFNYSGSKKVYVLVLWIVAIWTLFALGFRQKKMPETGQSDNGVEPEEEDKCDSVRPEDSQHKIKEKLLAYFEKEMPFLNSELSLLDVAEHLNTNITYLSRVINKEFNMNFYTFVNRFRTDYAVRLIDKDRNNLKIDILYRQAGFKSKSVFYKYFRDKTRQTPQEYKAGRR